MEITVRIDGQDKKFKQDTINFITMRKVLKWQERMVSQQKALIEYMKHGIEEEVNEEIVKSDDLFDSYEDLEFTADIICSFFAGQFTYDEFANGVYFKNIGEFYQLASDIFDLAFAQKEEMESKGKKKPTLKTQTS